MESAELKLHACHENSNWCLTREISVGGYGVGVHSKVICPFPLFVKREYITMYIYSIGYNLSYTCYFVCLHLCNERQKWRKIISLMNMLILLKINASVKPYFVICRFHFSKEETAQNFAFNSLLNLHIPQYTSLHGVCEALFSLYVQRFLQCYLMECFIWTGMLLSTSALDWTVLLDEDNRQDIYFTIQSCIARQRGKFVCWTDWFSVSYFRQFTFDKFTKQVFYNVMLTL